MSYNIVVTAYFSKHLKRLVKKFPSLKKEFAQLIASLKENPVQGTNLDNNCYKIRLAIASKQKGKSGGARVITYVQVVNTKI
jgi:mRNA-degrading endonuclease RelE of RelBE toxin-antitoxin system